MILGLRTIESGIQLDFKESDSVKWQDKILPMKHPILTPRMQPCHELQGKCLETFKDASDMLLPNGIDCNCVTSVDVKESLHDKHDVNQVTDSERHLLPDQRQQLKLVLRKFTRSFSGKLGLCPHCKLHLQMKPEDCEKLHHQRHCPAPNVNCNVFEQQLNQSVEPPVGVLSKVKGLADFAAPTFLVPKKRTGEMGFGLLGVEWESHHSQGPSIGTTHW